MAKGKAYRLMGQPIKDRGFLGQGVVLALVPWSMARGIMASGMGTGRMAGGRWRGPMEGSILGSL